MGCPGWVLVVFSMPGLSCPRCKTLVRSRPVEAPNVVRSQHAVRSGSHSSGQAPGVCSLASDEASPAYLCISLRQPSHLRTSPPRRAVSHNPSTYAAWMPGNPHWTAAKPLAWREQEGSSATARTRNASSCELVPGADGLCPGGGVCKARPGRYRQEARCASFSAQPRWLGPYMVQLSRAIFAVHLYLYGTQT